MEEGGVELQQEEIETPGKLSELFFTNPEIQDRYVDKTEFVLEEAFLRINLKKEEKDCLFNLWRQTLTEFREKNELVCHQQFHLGKAVQLAAEMADNYLGQKRKRSEAADEGELENTFCLLAAAILHDNGQLPETEEEKNIPQQSFYPRHVLRSIERARQIMKPWLATQGYEDEKQKRILAKVTVLIGATDLDLDDPFGKKGPPIWQWLENGQKPEELTGELVDGMERAITVLGPEAESLKQKQELLPWVKMITAADLGSYALTPDYPLEIVAFWQEVQQIFEENGELKSLRQNFPQVDLADFLLSRFLPQVENVYGGTLRAWLDPDGEWQKNWEQVRQRKERLEKIRKEGVDSDIGHLEGDVSPVKLLGIAEKYKLTENLKLRKALKEQSAALVKRKLKEPISIEQLSTKAIRAMLEAVKPEQRGEIMTAVFSASLETIKSENVKEASLIFSPDAYRWVDDQPDAEELMSHEAVVESFWQAKKRVEDGNFEARGIYGFRQGAWETKTNELLQETFDSVASLYEQGMIAGVNIGGADPKLEKFKVYVGGLIDKGIPFSCHMGLDRPEVLEANFEQFLEWTKKWKMRHGSEKENPILIIDGHLEEIVPLIRDKVGMETRISVVVTEVLRFLAQSKERIEKHPIWELWQLKDKIEKIRLGGGNYILKGGIGPILEIFAKEQARQRIAIPV